MARPSDADDAPAISPLPGRFDSGEDRARAVLAASLLTTVASVYPAFLTGALGPELRAELAMSEVFFGVAVGGFFLGAALGSAVLGRLGERWGAARLITVTLSASALVAIALATLADRGSVFAGLLVIGGVANAGSQASVNKLLSQATDPSRLGFAMAVKQSGMPGATLLGGLAVPAVALTIGWRWAFAASAILAVLALVLVRRVADEAPRLVGEPIANGNAPDASTSQYRGEPEPKPTGESAAEPAGQLTAGPAGQSVAEPTGESAAEPAGESASSPVGVSLGELRTERSTLWWCAAAGAFGAAAAGTLGSWLTSSAVDAGWSSGVAGVLLAAGAVAGISTRLVLGARADRRPLPLPLTVAGTATLVGALGALLLVPRSMPLHALAAVVAFGAGWSWPALFNFAIVRANPGAAARATGITQTGVYVGVLTGPSLMGVAVDQVGYGVGWTCVALSMAISGAIMIRIAHRLDIP